MHDLTNKAEDAYVIESEDDEIGHGAENNRL